MIKQINIHKLVKLKDTFLVLLKDDRRQATGDGRQATGEGRRAMGEGRRACVHVSARTRVCECRSVSVRLCLCLCLGLRLDLCWFRRCCFLLCVFVVRLCSTSPSGGNQVDGLPPAQHTGTA